MPVYMAKDVKDLKAALGENAEKCANRSLLADKFPEFPSGERDKESRRRSLERVIKCASVEPGNRRQWMADITAQRMAGFSLQLGGRLIVNQAVGVLENAGLCLDRFFGVPYIPGSALKGIASEGARMEAASDAERLAICGGEAEDGRKKRHIAGTVAFLSAYPEGAAKLVLDIVNCHHPKYYSSDDPMAVALDNESPNPQVFPAVEAGAVFKFNLALVSQSRAEAVKKILALPPDFNPLAKAEAWLKAGMTDHGIGAKTAAGYGWFQLCDANNSASGSGLGGQAGHAARPAPVIADFNEIIYKNSISRLLDSPGQRQQLAQAVKKLQKPGNEVWLKRFFEETKGKEYKALRAQEWYPHGMANV